MRLFDARLMKLLTFLTRRQAWLTPQEVGRSIQLNGRSVSARTIHRWFAFLREKGGFVYYPYPRANLLGLQDTLVRIHGLRRPEVASILPFGASFSVDFDLARGGPCVNQGYWVPGTHLESFKDFWRTALDLGLLEDVDIFLSRNTHYFYSPFERLIREDGVAELRDRVDNSHFEALLRRDLEQAFRVEVHDRIAASPLIVPIVVEHIWSHCSSYQVWRAIREEGGERLLQYAKGQYATSLTKPGAVLRLLQQQWNGLLGRFDEIFIQPRVFFDWPSLGRAGFFSMDLDVGSEDRMVEAAVQASERSIVTAVRPGLEDRDRCQLSCFLPDDQVAPLLRLVEAFHRGNRPAVLALQDREATVDLFQPSFCAVDWRLFDPSSLEWAFDGGAYAETLKTMRPHPAS